MTKAKPQPPRIAFAPDFEDGQGLRGGDDKVPFLFAKDPYVQAIVEAGGLPVMVPITEKKELTEHYLEFCDGVMILGSGLDIPAGLFGETPSPHQARVNATKTNFECQLLEVAMKKNLPTLGICNGLQVLNVLRGGTLWQDLPSECGTQHKDPDATKPMHRVDITPNTLLAKVVETESIEANSSHHQGIKDVGKGLVVNAKADDGLVEGLEDPSYDFLLAVQWHPEMMRGRRENRRLFEALLDAANRRRSSLR